MRLNASCRLRPALLLLLLGTATPATAERAKSAILLIGDGLGTAHLDAARLHAVGPGGRLAIDGMAVHGWLATASSDEAVTDSAAAATAMATGVRTRNRSVGMDPDGTPLRTVLEKARALGKAIGLVSTTQLTHATPAAFAAHVPDRKQHAVIAAQMLALRPEVLLGGGEAAFRPRGVPGCHPGDGTRADGRDLVVEAIADGYRLACDAEALEEGDPSATGRLLGLFADGGMARPFAPSLASMTATALAVLAEDPDGFVLVVEAGQIDWASHDNDVVATVDSVLGLDAAVAEALAFATRSGDTLVVVTADHETGGLRVLPDAGGGTGGEARLSMPDGGTFRVAWSTTGHTDRDVPVAASGPGAGGFAGRHHLTHVHDVIVGTLLDPLRDP